MDYLDYISSNDKDKILAKAKTLLDMAKEKNNKSFTINIISSLVDKSSFV